MKQKNGVRMLSLLLVLGFVTFFGLQANSQTQRQIFFSETIEIKPITPDVPVKYAGQQTVQALMEAFDAEYNRQNPKVTVNLTRKVGGVEIKRYVRPLTISEIDARYPRAEWLQRCP